MRRWADHLAVLGRVAVFDYPYVLAGRRSPDRLPKLIEAHREALHRAGPGRRVLAGKSMGSRVGCHVALDEPEIRALVCLGYPLRGGSGTLRDQVLLELGTPVMFVQGSRDPLCPLEELARVRARMRAPSELRVVEGADHSLVVTARVLEAQGTTQDALEQELVSAVGAFFDQYA